MTHWLFAALLLLPQSSAPNPRATGAVISGVVLSDDAAPVPIRHARVELSGQAKHTVITGDDGAFVFSGLAAGRYEIAADKLGVGRRVFSANLSSTAPTAIVVAPGQELRALRVVLPRGGVLAGVVTDTGGVPVEGAMVTAIVNTTGAITQSPVSAETDDEGRYRLFGVSPGTYVIRVSPPPAGRRDATSMIPLETYYPNADASREAIAVTIAAREERPGLDVTVRRARRVEVSGSVRDAAGAEVDALVRLSRAGALSDDEDLTTTARDGAFMFDAVAPGSYVIRATHKTVEASGGDRPRGTILTAVEAVDVTTGARTDISLVVQPPSTLSGRATLTASAAESAAPPLPRLALVQGDALFTAPIQANGSFVFNGLTPGAYTLRPLTIAESGAAAWLVDSAVIDGRNVLGQPIEITTAARTGLAVSVTPHVGGLRGRISNAAGRGAPELAIVVMSTDRQKWTSATGRPVSVWPDTNGDWLIPALAAGDYFVAALADVTAADLLRVDFLEAVANASVTVGVKAGIVAVQDLKIR